MKTFFVFLYFIWTFAIVLEFLEGIQGDENCRIQNIALHKTATQSSELFGGLAELAVDGNMNPHYLNGSCTHTENYGPRWWKVDLGFIAKIVEVTIANRIDEYSAAHQRLQQFETCLSNSTVNTLNERRYCHNQTEPLGDAEIKSYSFGSAGQVVLINKFGNETGALTLCEVQVFAEVCPFVTSSTESFQSTSTNLETTSQTSEYENVSFASSSPKCFGRHRANVSIPKTDEEVLAQIEILKAALTVDKKTTSSSRRKLMSAGDERTSSKSIGVVGIVMLCAPVVFIVAIDLSRCVSWWSGVNK